MTKTRPALGIICLLLAACGSESLDERQSDTSQGLAGRARGNQVFPPVEGILDRQPAAANPDRNAYYGDLHVHTANSFDAYSFGTTATPADAYRYAQGEALAHPVGFEVRLQQPLDFYAVTDHAMFMGLVKAGDVDPRFSQYPITEPLHGINREDNRTDWSIPARGRAFSEMVPAVIEGMLDGSIDAASPPGGKQWRPQTRPTGPASSPPSPPLNTLPLPTSAATCIAMSFSGTRIDCRHCHSLA